MLLILECAVRREGRRSQRNEGVEQRNGLQEGEDVVAGNDPLGNNEFYIKNIYIKL